MAGDRQRLAAVQMIHHAPHLPICNHLGLLDLQETKTIRPAETSGKSNFVRREV